MPPELTRPAAVSATSAAARIAGQLPGDGDYVVFGVREVSPDGRLLAYSADFDGEEVYQLRIRDLSTGTDRPERMERSYYGLAWSADSRSVFYTVIDAIYRPYQRCADLHRVREPRHHGNAVPAGIGHPFGPSVGSAPPARHRGPGRSWRRPGRRRAVPGHQRRCCRVPADAGPVAAPGADRWAEVVPESAATRLVACDAFGRYLVLTDRHGAGPRLRVLDRQTGAERGDLDQQPARRAGPGR